VVLQYKAYVNGAIYEDTTKSSKKGIAFVFGSRPLPPGIPPGFEEGLSTMKSGGKRLVDVPPKLGFGDEATVVQSRLTKEAFEIPSNSEIRYEIELIRVSIPPS
jgi:FKBP-type peptidyl-prolyl cis-trans isomerase